MFWKCHHHFYSKHLLISGWLLSIQSTDIENSNFFNNNGHSPSNMPNVLTPLDIYVICVRISLTLSKYQVFWQKRNYEYGYVT